MKTNEYIRSLSIKDKKTLSQKALKLSEEVGELARVILPFDSAPGTSHRFVDRESILEEVVDVYLSSMSIAYSLDFTDDEIEEMIIRKSEKWSGLQAAEEKSEFPLPFEIHVTVDFDELFTSVWSDKIQTEGVIRYPVSDRVKERKEWSDKILDKFKDVCVQIGVKPIVIDLEINDGSIIKDVMTSSKHFGDNRTAYEESIRIVSELGKRGYKVVRNKIESVPWHMKAPLIIESGKEITDGCYFESHMGVIIENDERKLDLNRIVENLSKYLTFTGIMKLSKNYFKKMEDGKYINILTYRSNKCGSVLFKNEIDSIKENLEKAFFKIEKVEIEFAVYDTNINHDSKWISNGNK